MLDQNKIFGDVSFDIRAFVVKVAKKWRIFALISPLVLLGTALFLYTSPKIYQVAAVLLIEDQNDAQKIMGGDPSNVGRFGMLNQEKNIQNEIEEIRSYNSVLEVIGKLNHHIDYYRKVNFLRDRELYKDSPIQVLLEDDSYQLFNEKIQIRFIDANQYEVFVNVDEFWTFLPQTNETREIKEKFTVIKKCKYNELCKSDYFAFRIFKRDTAQFENNLAKLQEDEYSFMVNMPEQVALNTFSSIQIEPTHEKSTALKIVVKTSLPEKSVDFLTKLFDVYQSKKLTQMNAFAEGTIKFIDDQLASVTDSLQGAENRMVSFQKSRNSINIDETAKNSEGRLIGLETEREQLTLKNKYYKNLLTNIQKDTNVNAIVAPFAVGIEDPVLTDLILELKRLNTEKISSSFKGTLNPEVEILNKKLDLTKKTLVENVRGIVEASNISLTDINTRIAKVRFELGAMPESERRLSNIQRKFVLNDNLYNYLLQRKAEAEIVRAATISNLKVLDSARLLSETPIEPKKSLISGVGVVLSLLIPLLIITVMEYLNRRVETVEQIENNSSIPILANIPKGSSAMQPGFWRADYQTEETFRGLALKLLRLDTSIGGKVFAISSYIPGEGKNYCSMYLAAALARMGKRTVFLNTDLRKGSVINEDTGTIVGLNDYLHKGARLNDIISEADKNIYTISVGQTDKESIVLRNSSRLLELFTELKKQFDFIVINTPPIGLVSDFFVLTEYTNVIMFVVRHGYTNREHVMELEKITQSSRLSNVYLLYNGSVEETQKYFQYENYYTQNGADEGKAKRKAGAKKS